MNDWIFEYLGEQQGCRIYKQTHHNVESDEDRKNFFINIGQLNPSNIMDRLTLGYFIGLENDRLRIDVVKF